MSVAPFAPFTELNEQQKNNMYNLFLYTLSPFGALIFSRQKKSTENFVFDDFEKKREIIVQRMLHK